MVSAPATQRFSDITRTAAQTRVLDAALTLFSQHGVSGTSLQMIADTIGYTKAAVYRQFKTKDEIVIALAERELGGFEPALEAAEAAGNPIRAREILLDQMIDITIERRRVIPVLQFDPVVVRLLAEHQAFQQFVTRLYAVLINDNSDAARVNAAMLSGAITVGVMHPLVADMDDDALRADLLRTTRRILGLPSRRPRRR